MVPCSSKHTVALSADTDSNSEATEALSVATVAVTVDMEALNVPQVVMVALVTSNVATRADVRVATTEQAFI